VIGTQIDISYFKGSFLWKGVLIIPIAACARILATVVGASGTIMGASERFFLALAWLPKATVQAALAPQALGQARKRKDPELTSYAETVSYRLAYVDVSICPSLKHTSCIRPSGARPGEEEIGPRADKLC
jgi:Kef-type K+ transport system membrane component KefB